MWFWAHSEGELTIEFIHPSRCLWSYCQWLTISQPLHPLPSSLPAKLQRRLLECKDKWHAVTSIIALSYKDVRCRPPVRCTWPHPIPHRQVSAAGGCEVLVPANGRDGVHRRPQARAGGRGAAAARRGAGAAPGIPSSRRSAVSCFTRFHRCTYCSAL